MRNLAVKDKRWPAEVSASMWFLVCSFLQKGISTLTTPMFTRLLTTEEYGRFHVFNSWLSIVTIFVTMNIYYGVYNQGLVKFSDDRGVFSSSLQGLTTCLTIVWTIIYFCFQSFWNDLLGLTTVQMFSMLIMIWSTAVFNFWAAEKRCECRYRRLVAITLSVSFAKPAIGIMCVLSAEDKVTARILSLALVEVIGYTGLFLSQVLRGKKLYSKKYWQYVLRLNIPLIPHYLSQTVLSSADRIMISNMIGHSEAGIYSLAYSLAMIMTLFNTAMIQTIEPWIYKKIKADETAQIGTAAYSLLLVIAILNLILIAFAPEAVTIFAPSKYYDAVWVIPPIAMSVFFMFSYNLFACFEFYFEKTKYIVTATTAGAVLNIFLNYVLMRRYSYYVAGYTTLFCYMLYAVFHYLFMMSIWKNHMRGIMVYDWKILLFITFGFLGVGFLFLFTYNYIMVRYSLIIIMLIAMIGKRKYISYVIKRIFKMKTDDKGNTVI